MGAKKLYLDNRHKYRENIRIAKDLSAQEAVNRGFNRYIAYKSTWQTVDLDELVEKLFKNPEYKNTGQKFEISDPNSNYIIYCDNGGSYFRIGDKNMPKDHKGHFLKINLEQALNEKIDGRISGINPQKRQAFTHFKMLIKKKG